MKTSLKLTSLAALTAATLALPAAAAGMQPTQAKCQAKMGMSKCAPKHAGKCAPTKKHARAKCGAKTDMAKGAPKHSGKCAPMK